MKKLLFLFLLCPSSTWAQAPPVTVWVINHTNPDVPVWINGQFALAHFNQPVPIWLAPNEDGPCKLFIRYLDMNGGEHFARFWALGSVELHIGLGPSFDIPFLNPPNGNCPPMPPF